MKVLVTGGTGVVGTAAVRALLAQGHSVRLFSRHAADDAARWGQEVEPRSGSVASAAEVTGAAEGCDAILHIAGIAEENPPDVTFEKVNVDGTRHLLTEAERAGVERFVYVSSLGADRGSSAYHASKMAAEDLVRLFARDWLICRPGNVYGPGDEVISYLLQIVRSSPAAPMVDLGDQPFQPLDAEDCGAALALAVSRRDLSRQVLLMAGPEVTHTQDLLDRLARITGTNPIRIPIPAPLATLGAQAASLFGLRVPLDDNKVAMLREGNVLQPGEVNAVTEILGIQPIPLDEGLRRLANSQPEQLPRDGTGTLMRRLYYTPFPIGARAAGDLFREFRDRFFEIVPENTMGEAGEPVGQTRVETGATLTLSLPLRGHVQVRVAEITDSSMTLVTVAGHPLAGAVTFRVTGEPGLDLRFEVETCDRPSNLLDGLAMMSIGSLLKHQNWSMVVERAVTALSGVTPGQVRMDEHPLEGEEEREAIAAIERKVAALARSEEPGLREEARERVEFAGKPA